MNANATATASFAERYKIDTGRDYGSNKPQPAASKADEAADEVYSQPETAAERKLAAHSQEADPQRLEISFTRVEGQSPLTKTLTVNASGALEKSKAKITLYRGTAHKETRAGTATEILISVGKLLAGLTANEAIITAPPPPGQEKWQIVTGRELDHHPGAISRNEDTFVPSPGPALFGMDFDTADFPEALLARIAEVGDISRALALAYPPFADAACLRRNSSSAAVALKGGAARPSGHHRYYVASCGTSSESFAGILAERLMLAGFLWGRVAENGAILPRTLFDINASSAPSRLFYEADPIIADERLEYAKDSRATSVTLGGMLDLDTIVPLSEGERVRLDELQAELKRSLEPQAAAARAAWQESRIARLIAKGIDPARARRTISGAIEKQELTGDFEIVLDDETTVTVREILDNPHAYHECTCRDPVEPSYGAGKAKIYSDQNRPAINSFAHGGAIYRLAREPGGVFDIEPAGNEPSSGDSHLEPQDIFGHATELQLRNPPTGCLPAAIERWAISEARRKGVPLAFTAAAALAAVSGAIGSSLRIQVRQRDTSFTEPAALWVVLVADPGSAKSAVINAALKPLRDMESEWKQSDLPRHAEWAKRAKALARKGSPAEPEPRLRRVLVDDVTAEMQIRIHAANPRGLTRSTDELAAMLETLGAYKRSGGGDRSFMLRLFDGGEITVDRVAAGTISAQRALMAVLAGTQPDKLRTMVSGMETDGLLQRFLFISDAGPRSAPIDEEQDVSAASEYRNLLRGLASAEYVFPSAIRIADDARPAIRAFLDRCEALSNMPGISTAWKGHVSKVEKIATRIILCFHAVELFSFMEQVALEVPVSKTTVERALAFASFLLRHSLSFYETFFDRDPSQAEALGLAGYLLTRRDLTTIKRRDVYQARASLKGPENRRALANAVRALEENGWLAVSERDADGACAWRVNPRIHELFAARAEYEQRERSRKHEQIKRAAEARRELQEVAE